MLQNYNFYRVMSVFLENPTKGFGWRELSKKARLGPASVRRYMNDMKKEGMITDRIVAGRKLYFANRESRKYRLYITFGMQLNIENSGLVEFLNGSYGHPAIILFGSYATGEATEDSDIDIAVITESVRNVEIKRFENVMKKEIHLFRFSK